MTHLHHVLVVTIALALGASACGSKPSEPPAPAAAPPAPPVDRETLLREAAEKLEAEKEKVREKLRAAGSGTVKKKKLLGKKGERKLELDFEFTNAGDKTLTLAEGSVEFRDASDKPLKRFKVPFQEPIAPGKKASRTGRFPLDQGSEVDKALAETPLDKLTTVWMPTRYRFEDGSELRAD